ncbi:UNVERIFIED_CONTAM: hypothetical protein Sradi_0778700 [Sesamum radiatum]|uniref:Transposase MuDR plant domain-containing protein n=1 Tax=Sesamum radiatum TaxID=300843 RepID=A0AAW2VQK3_SESRA
MTSSDLHDVHFWYGGKFVDDKKSKYVGGIKKVFEGVDIDYLGMYELGIMYDKCGGRKGTMNFYYKVSGLPLELGLRRINNECPDICICDLENQYRGIDLPIEIYVDEMDCEPIQTLDEEGNVVPTQQEEEIRCLLDGVNFDDDLEFTVSEGGLERQGWEFEGVEERMNCEGQGLGKDGIGFVYEGVCDGGDCEGQGEQGQGGNGECQENEMEGDVGMQNLNTENVNNENFETENAQSEQMQAENTETFETENAQSEHLQSENVRVDKGKRKISYAENQSSSEFDDSSDEDYLQPNEASTDSETPSLVLEDLEVSSNEDIFLNKNPSKRDLMHKLRRVMKKKKKKTEKQPNVEVDKIWFSDDGEHDELESLPDSENEDSLPKHDFFKESTNIKTCQLEVGMKFHDGKHFREVLRDWCIRGGFDIEYVKNEKVRVTAKCKTEGCNWRIHASPIMNDFFQIKSIKGAHTCARTYDNKLARASYLAKRMESAIRDHPNIPVQQQKNTNICWIICKNTHKYSSIYFTFDFLEFDAFDTTSSISQPSCSSSSVANALSPSPVYAP